MHVCTCSERLRGWLDLRLNVLIGGSDLHLNEDVTEKALSPHKGRGCVFLRPQDGPFLHPPPGVTGRGRQGTGLSLGPAFPGDGRAVAQGEEAGG